MAYDYDRRNARTTTAGYTLRQFKRDYPYHSVLEMIDENRRTVIGDGLFDVEGRLAGALIHQKLVDVIEGPFGRELELASKGRRYLDESSEAIMEI